MLENKWRSIEWTHQVFFIYYYVKYFICPNTSIKNLSIIRSSFSQLVFDSCTLKFFFWAILQFSNLVQCIRSFVERSPRFSILNVDLSLLSLLLPFPFLSFTIIFFSANYSTFSNGPFEFAPGENAGCKGFLNVTPLQSLSIYLNISQNR